MSLTLVTPPSSEPLQLGEIKDHLRIDDDDNDSFLEGAIVVAREVVEGCTNRALISQVWDMHLDYFPAEILVPKPKLISIDSITYVDTNGDTQTLDPTVYQVDSRRVPGRVAADYCQSWPSTRRQMNAVTIRFTCGYGNRTDVPKSIKTAMKLYIGHLFKNREETAPIKLEQIPFGIEALLGPYIIPRTFDY